MRSPSVIIGGLSDAHLLGVRCASDLAHRHLAEPAHKAALAFARQRLPNWTRHTLAHRAIQASTRPRTSPVSQAAATRRVLSSYQRCVVWDIDCRFRDTEDLRLGLGMGSIHVSIPARRDRLWLLNALAIALLTLLRAAGEALDYDRYLKSNTSKQRTHSLFRQGCILYELIPTMPELRLLPLIERFAMMLAQLPVFADTFGGA
jgi:hypothetical protein